MMEDTKFTPGPWTFNASEKWPFGMSIEPNITRIDRIASSTAQNTLDDLRAAVGFEPHEREKIVGMIRTQEANMHLITAAPALYKTLEFVSNVLDEITEYPHVLSELEMKDAMRVDHALHEARVVMAKARGER